MFELKTCPLNSYIVPQGVLHILKYFLLQVQWSCFRTSLCYLNMSIKAFDNNLHYNIP